MSHTCRQCGVRAYSDWCWQHKPRKPIESKKRIQQRGKEYERWKEFRENVAIPYLDKTFGHTCRCCGVGGQLDIDHIHNKGSRPELKYQLSNLQYLCRECHINKTARIKCLH